jgi:hypothetical protein
MGGGDARDHFVAFVRPGTCRRREKEQGRNENGEKTSHKRSSLFSLLHTKKQQNLSANR